MSFNFFQIAMLFFVFIGIGSDSLFLVSAAFAALYIKQQLEMNKMKNLLLFNTKDESQNISDNADVKNQSHEKTSEDTARENANTRQHENYENDQSEEDILEWDKPKLTPVWSNKPKEFFDKIYNFINGIDLITKLGSLIFLIGIGFLIKYTSSLFEITPVMKISGGILLGISVFGIGLKLFVKHPRYGATLEGLGLGITYLSIYLGLILYNLYSVNFALMTMIAISAAMIFISFKQNKEILSGVALLGAFLAPVLASSESGNIFLLTSYFLLINLSMLCIVFYKNWTFIVIESFLLTFATLSVWFIFNTFDGNTICLLPLTAIIIIYIYAPLRILDKDALKEKYLSVIVCGTPAVISTLHYNLLPDIGYIKSMSAIGFGLIYLLVFRNLITRIKTSVPNTSRAYEVIGIVMLSFSILFVTNTMVASIAWAFEATLGLWWATKQNVKWRIYFCLSILMFAILSWISSIPYYGDLFFFNVRSIGTLIITGSIMYSAFLIKEMNPKPLSIAMLFLGSLWLLLEMVDQLTHYFGYEQLFEFLLSIFIAGMMIASCELQKRINWKASILVFEYMTLVVFLLTLMTSVTLLHYNDFYFGFMAPALITSIVYDVFYNSKNTSFFLRKDLLTYVLYTTVILYVASLIDSYYFDTIFIKDYIIALSLSMIGMLALMINRKIIHFTNGLEGKSELIKGASLATLMTLTVTSSALSPDVKYSYLPVISFVDLVLIGTFYFIWQWWRENGNEATKKLIEIQIAGSVFLGFSLTILLLRFMHYFLSIPYELDFLLENSIVQASLTLLWAVIGLFVVYYSTVKDNDVIKKTGMIILGIVTVKLFTVDISDGLSRVIAFIVVGALYLLFGYWLQKKEKSKK